jgi:MFS superfamily sulfate permease-like transporter
MLKLRVPDGLVVLGLGIAVSAALKLHDKFDVDVVGRLPTGLPTPSFPSVEPGQWAMIVAGAAGVTLIALSEAASVGQDLARSRNENYDLDDDLFAFGVGNLCNATVGGIVGAGSLSASSVNQSAGAKTQFSSAVAALAALCTLLFLSGILRDLPEAVLGALILHAVARHLVPTVVFRIRRYSQMEFWMAVIAVVGVLLFDALGGLLLAMAINLAVFVHRTYATSISEVGTLPGVARRVRISEHPKAVAAEGELALRINNALFFGNAVGAVGAVEHEIKRARAAGRHITRVVLDLSTQTALDMTSAAALVDLSDRLHREGTEFQFVEVHTKVQRDLVEARRMEHAETQLDLSRGPGSDVPLRDSGDERPRHPRSLRHRGGRKVVAETQTDDRATNDPAADGPSGDDPSGDDPSADDSATVESDSHNSADTGSGDGDSGDEESSDEDPGEGETERGEEPTAEGST